MAIILRFLSLQVFFKERTIKKEASIVLVDSFILKVG